MIDFSPVPKFFNYGGSFIGGVYSSDLKRTIPAINQFYYPGWYIPVPDIPSSLQNDIIELLKKHFHPNDVNFALSEIQETEITDTREI